MGDFNGDGKADIALVGGSPWNTIPIAFSNGDGSFNTTNGYVGDFATSWAIISGAQILSGDFNGDGKTDIALVGGSGWSTIPVAFSNGDGNFTVTNGDSSFFELCTAQGTPKPVVADFNGDGRADIALVGGSPWNTIPIAFSNGDGSFNTTNGYVGDFATSWAIMSGVQMLPGDFNGDGKTDIALIGNAFGNTIPVAFSNGDGNFTVTNGDSSFFELLTAQGNPKPMVGDFNGDGRADIALVGGSPWNTIPIAISYGDGSFSVTNGDVGYFATSSAITGGVQIVSGDFNGDGKTDIVLIGGGRMEHHSSRVLECGWEF